MVNESFTTSFVSFVLLVLGRRKWSLLHVINLFIFVVVFISSSPTLAVSSANLTLQQTDLTQNSSVGSPIRYSFIRRRCGWKVLEPERRLMNKNWACEVPSSRRM